MEISLGQIAANYRAIRQAVGTDIEVMPVVKADAYRHGAVEVSRTLEGEGARWLAVSNTEEGVALREAGIRARILVMADFLPFTREAMLEHRLTPVIHSLQDLAHLDEMAVKRQERIAYHLKIDTGMGRLGTRASAEEIGSAILQARHVDIEGLMTHFASAGNYVSNQTDEQVKLFEQFADGLALMGIHPKYLHLSSTIPVAYARKRAWGGLVRPGHAVYGYVSQVSGRAPDELMEVAPALTWWASVLAIKDLPAGAWVGYGGMFKTPHPMRVAILAAGYADGIPHRLSNRGSVIAQDQVVPMLGAVSMDLTTIDATSVPGLTVGDSVALLGGEGETRIDAQQIARLAGTISYSVLTGISARVKRVYV